MDRESAEGLVAVGASPAPSEPNDPVRRELPYRGFFIPVSWLGMGRRIGFALFGLLAIMTLFAEGLLDHPWISWFLPFRDTVLAQPKLNRHGGTLAKLRLRVGT